MATRYQVLVQQQTDLMAEANTLLDIAEPTEEQTARLAAIEGDDGELAKVNKELKVQNGLREQMRTAPAVENMAEPIVNEATINQPEPKGKGPFRSLGEQLIAVAKSALPGAGVDERLLAIQAAASGATEGTLSEGGFLVQSDFSSDLLRLVHETGKLSARTDRTTISGNSNGLKINAVDETSRVNGSRWGGVQAYWIGEGTAPTSTKPKFRQMELTLQKLAGLFYATDELLADASALDSIARTAFAEEFGFKLDDAIIRGTGAGQPLGILGHAGTVSVSKETGQAAATIVKENVEKMYARAWAPSVARGEWYINQDCWPQLFALSQAVGTGGVPVFLPPGGLSAAPYGSLLGRPVNPIEQCETLGTVGDIIFADFSQYKMIEKGGIDAASSIHVLFTTDEMTFRFILRTDGQPKRNAPLTPFKGSNTQSPFVTLATRA